MVAKKRKTKQKKKKGQKGGFLGRLLSGLFGGKRVAKAPQKGGNLFPILYRGPRLGIV